MSNSCIYVCPVCSKKSSTFHGLVIHFSAHISDECPLCGWKGKSVIAHLFWSAKRELGSGRVGLHTIYYGLVVRRGNKASRGRVWKKAREWAERACRVW